MNQGAAKTSTDLNVIEQRIDEVEEMIGSLGYPSKNFALPLVSLQKSFP